jgi:ribonuclease HII
MTEDNEATQRRGEGVKKNLTASLRRVVSASTVGTLFEEQARREGYLFIAGVDEVGRGPLAGPVVAAAVILTPDAPLPTGLNDSKKLTAKRREALTEIIKQTALAYAYGQIEAEEIDRINILEATKRAMLSAIAALAPPADFLLIDALQLKGSPLPQRAVIRGDAIVASIAAASIVAKTYRDQLMRQYHDLYPQYGFDRHAGYGTAAHLAALREHGPCPIHRLSFRGVIIA